MPSLIYSPTKEITEKKLKNIFNQIIEIIPIKYTENNILIDIQIFEIFMNRILTYNLYIKYIKNNIQVLL